MATRLYLPSSAAAAAPNSPAFDASWEATGSAIRRTLELTKDEIALASSGVATTLNSPAGAVDVLIAQYISAPLASNVTISGAIQGQVRAFESSATGDLRIQTVIRVLQSDYSTVRGTLIASSGAALSNEFNTALRNIKIPLNGSTVPTSVAAQTGDVIVVEIGYRKHENATTSRTGTFSLGAVSGGTDLAIDETTTTANVPWIEFTEALTFATVSTRVTQVVGQVAITPPTVETRVTQAVAQAAITPATVETRATQLVAQVAILQAGAVIGGGQGSFTVNAFIKRTVSSSFTVNAVVLKTQPKTFTVDAVIKRTISPTGFTVDAEKTTSHLGNFTLNAVIKRTQTGSFTVKAWIPCRFTLDAWIRAPGRFTVDAIVRAPTSGAFLVAAYISRSFFHIDAQIRSGGTFTVNAVIKKNQPKTFTVNAWLFSGTWTKSFKVDANLRRGGAGSWYVNAELRLPHVERDKTFHADAVIRGSNAGSFDINAWIIDRHKAGSFTIDADTRGQNEKRGAFTVRAVIRLAGSGAFSVNALIGGNGYFRVDAYIRPYFRIDAEIAARTVVTKTFTIDAQIYSGHFTGSFGVGAEIWKSGTQTGRYFWLDAWIYGSSGPKQFTVNAQVRGGGSFTIDAFVRPSFTVDAFIRSNVTIIWPDDPGGPPTDPDGNPLPPGFKSARKWRVQITIDGVDVTGDVNWSRTSFTQNAKTNPGTFELVLYGPQPYNGGETVLVTLDDFRTFGGYVLQIERGYIFDSDADWPVTFLRGADFNVLFDKLITYNKGSVDDTSGKYTPYKSFAKGSLDTRIINKVFGSYVDLPAGFDYKLFVDSVGVAAPEKPWAMPTSGSPLRQVMQSLSQVTEAVWWIDPYLRLHYGSRTQVTAPFPITDGAGGISSRQLSMSEDMSQLVTDGFLWGTLAYTTEGEIKVEHQHSSLYGSLGPWQYGEFRSDIHHTAYLERRMDSVIERYGKPVKRAQVVIFEPGYQAGQVADIRLTEHGLEAPLVIRSMLLTFAVGKEPDGTKYYCVPRFELSVGLDPEEPWDIYDYLPFPPYPYDDPGGWARGQDIQQQCIDDNSGGGGGTCEEICGITDSLAREVAVGWGTSDYGPDWTSNHGAGASSNVTGYGDLLISQSGGGGSAHEDLPVIVPDTFDLTFEFQVYSSLADNDVDPAGWISLLVTTTSGYEFHVNLTQIVGYTTLPAGLQGYSYIQANGDSYTDFNTFVPAIGVWYTCRFARDATTLYVKFWESGTTEPAGWLATTSADAPFAFTGVPKDVQFALEAGTIEGSEVFFRNLDIAGISRCSAQFEDFNRTVTNSWGITTSGMAWLPTNASLSVDGSNAVRTIPVSPSTPNLLTSYVVAEPGVSAPWNTGSVFTMRTAWKTSSVVSTGSQYGTIEWEFYRDSDGSLTQFGVQIDNAGGNIYGRGGSGVPGEFFLAKNDWLANTWYEVAIEFDPGNYMKFKMWLQGATEPVDWTGEISDVGFDPITTASHSEFQVLVGGGFTSTTRTISFDYIDFDYDGKGCGATDATVIDNFERTVSLGTSLEGTSSVGDWWVSPPNGLYGVSGGVGQIQVQAPTSGYSGAAISLNEDTSHVSPYFTPGLGFPEELVTGFGYGRNDAGTDTDYSIDIMCDRWSNVSSQPTWAVIGLYAGTPATEETGTEVSLQMSGGTTFDRFMLNGYGNAHSYHESQTPFTFVNNVWYTVRVAITGETVTAKVWARGGIEPGWMMAESVDPLPWPVGEFSIYFLQYLQTPGATNWYIDNFRRNAVVVPGAGGSDPSAPGGPCADDEGETYGAVTQGWGCETIKAVAGYVELTGQAAQGTLTVYDADTGDFIDVGDFDVNDGKTFLLPGNHDRVIACYRNYTPEIGSNPSVPRLPNASVGRRYE